MTERSGESVLCGLVGRGIGGSRTPRMHEAEGARQGLRCLYRRFDFDEPALENASLADVLRAAELCGFAGLNVTYPFKIEVVDLLDDVSDDARRVGAVNTVVFREGRRIGHNTDCHGFREAFRTGLPDAPLGAVLLLGAGGAGVAVAAALMDLGVARLQVHDLDAARSRSLATRLEREHGAGRAVAVDAVGTRDGLDGLVNATPVGMAKLPGLPAPPGLLKPPLWVADVVYVPLETELLATARAAGLRVLPGSGMAVHQAVRAFELFTGRPADVASMEKTFRSFDI